MDETHLVNMCACRDQMQSFVEMLAINDCHQRRPNRNQRRARAQLPVATSAGHELLHGMGDPKVGHAVGVQVHVWQAGSTLYRVADQKVCSASKA